MGRGAARHPPPVSSKGSRNFRPASLPLRKIRQLCNIPELLTARASPSLRHPLGGVGGNVCIRMYMGEERLPALNQDIGPTLVIDLPQPNQLSYSA